LKSILNKHVAILIHSKWFTGFPNKQGNSVTNSRSSLLRISIVILDFKSHNLIMSARAYFMKTVHGCNNLSVSLQDVQCRRVYLLCFFYCSFLVLISKNVCSRNINKQIVIIADQNPKDYSFLSSYHYNKSKNYLKIRFRIRHWIPMFVY